MANISFSIVTPSFNSAGTIVRAIESVLENRYPYCDYLVVDGASGDDTASIARRYAGVRVISEPDAGQSDAINKGFARTKGDVLGWVNADDVLTPGTLFAVARFMENHPEAVAVYGGCMLIDESGREIRASAVQPFDLWRLIHSRNFIEQSSCFFRRSAFEAVGGVDTGLKYVMDWDLWIKLSAVGEVAYVPEIFSARRITASNKTESGGFERFSEIRSMLGRYGAIWRSPVIFNYLAETVATWARWRRGPLGYLTKGFYSLSDTVMRPFFFRRMNAGALGSFPNGDIPPQGRIVLPPSAGGNTLVLKFLPAPVENVDVYCVKISINRRSAGAVCLRPASNEPVEKRIDGLDPRRYNLIEFSSRHGRARHDDLYGCDVKVSANVRWSWI